MISRSSVGYIDLSSGYASARRMRVEFIFLALAQAALRVAVRPELALCDVLETCNANPNAEDFGFSGAVNERLVASVGCELNSTVFESRARKRRLLSEDNMHGKRVHRLDICVYCQPADQAIGTDSFADLDQEREVRPTALCHQLVRLQRSHDFTLRERIFYKQSNASRRHVKARVLAWEISNL
jgi:hypothetical protein